MSSQLRKQVESVLPGWETWYPSLFDAAQDLGLIKARVCPPASLVLATRHAGIYSEAVQAFREKWGVEQDEPVVPLSALRLRGTAAIRNKKSKRRSRRR